MRLFGVVTHFLCVNAPSLALIHLSIIVFAYHEPGCRSLIKLWDCLHCTCFNYAFPSRTNSNTYKTNFTIEMQPNNLFKGMSCLELNLSVEYQDCQSIVCIGESL